MKTVYLNFRRSFRAWVALIPLVIIVSVFFLTWGSAVNSGLLCEGKTYSIWLVEAEVAPLSADSSAPDLVGYIEWQGQVVLRTLTARNCLIARWDPIGLAVGQILEGEVGTSSLQRVGRIRHTPQGRISVAVFAQGFLTQEFIGGIDVPLSCLKLGLNTIQHDGRVRRIQLAVVDAGGDLENHEWAVTEQVHAIHARHLIVQRNASPSHDLIAP
jgi:hypothetical protein